MPNRTSIEWCRNPDGTPGYTWNPITGCLKGCPYCYARKLANGRLRSRYRANSEVAWYKIRWAERAECQSDPFYPRLWQGRLDELDRLHKWYIGMDGQPDREKPKGVFACDMGELFGPWLPREWTEKVLTAIQGNPQHRFYLLTKQPAELVKWSPFPENCWVGVSVTDVQSFCAAVRELAGVEAGLKYLSMEPLLEWPEHAEDFIDDTVEAALRFGGIRWLIIGAQTRPYRPPELSWVHDIVGAASDAHVPVFLKNNLFNSHTLCELEQRQEMPDVAVKRGVA